MRLTTHRVGASPAEPDLRDLSLGSGWAGQQMQAGSGSSWSGIGSAYTAGRRSKHPARVTSVSGIT